MRCERCRPTTPPTTCLEVSAHAHVWFLCFAGLLPFQRSRKIRFARAPKRLDMGGDHPLARCSGWTNVYGGCNLETSYADDDIFYLEVCLFNQICSNRGDLFSVEAGDDFFCDFSEDGFNELQQILFKVHGRSIT